MPNSADFIADSSRPPVYSGNDAFKPAEVRCESIVPSVFELFNEPDALIEMPFCPRADFSDSSATRIDCSVRRRSGLFVSAV